MPKTGQPDTSDAQVMIALYEAQAAHNLGEVMGYIWSNDFPTDFKEFRQRFERGSNSSEERSIQRALGYFETIGTLHRNNLINEDLVFDWIAIDMAWGRLKAFVGGIRRETATARMYENFEYMARRSANWKPARSRLAAASKRPAKRTRPAAKRTRPATKRARPATKKARPAAKRTAATTRTRPTAAKRTRAAAKRTRPAAKRTRPAAKPARATAKKARPATKKARPAAKKTARPAAKRTAAANRARPAATRTRPAAARGRTRTAAARKRG